MFSHADRLPTYGPADVRPRHHRPWGLGRMDRYLHTIEVPSVRIELDPVSQTARYIGQDGFPIVEGKHRATGTGTEGPATQTGRGDGQHPGGDEDHGQDSDSD